MKIYRVSYYSGHREHQGYAFFPSKKKADEAARDAKVDDMVCEVEPLTVGPGKQGLLNFLNLYAEHPDNG